MRQGGIQALLIPSPAGLLLAELLACTPAPSLPAAEQLADEVAKVPVWLSHDTQQSCAGRW